MYGQDMRLSKCSKFSNTFPFLFLNECLANTAGIDKMLVRKANREDPDHTASESGSTLSRPFCSQLVVQLSNILV